MKKLLCILAPLVALAAAIFIFAACNVSAGNGGESLPSDDQTVTEPEAPLPQEPSAPDEPAPEQPKPDEPSKPEIYTIIFVADGQTVASLFYKVGGEITEPAVPEKAGYTAAWERYSLDGGNKTVEAVYEKIPYNVTFYADGKELAFCVCPYLEELIYPAIPVKYGCTAVWGEPTVDGYEVAVNAIYTAVDYTVTFVAEGATVAKFTYTVLDNEISPPEVPVKKYYGGVWEEYTLSGGDVTVNAVYTPITYRVEFMANGEIVSSQTYDVENTAGVTEPEIPDRIGSEGSWEKYALNGGDITVNAVYVALKGSEFLEYTAVEGGFKVKKYTGGERKVVVPAEHGGKPVIGISDYAFSGSGVEEVHIAEGIQSIGYCAFYNCNSMKKALLPDSLTFMDEAAFSHCGLLESVKIPSGLEVIPAEAFDQCGLKEITFSEGLREICDKAFYLCPELKVLNMPSSLEKVGEQTFACCYKLEKVVFGENFSYIGKCAFYECNALGEVVLYEAEGWSDEPENYQTDLPALIAQSPASAASVFKTYVNAAYVKKR